MSWSGRLPRCSANAMRCGPKYGNSAKIQESIEARIRMHAGPARMCVSRLPPQTYHGNRCCRRELRWSGYRSEKQTARITRPYNGETRLIAWVVSQAWGNTGRAGA